MKNFFRKIEAVVLAAGQPAGAACSDDENTPSLLIDPVERTPLPVVSASGSYCGNDRLGCDHYTVCLCDGNASVTDGEFSGDGMGVCLEFYAPTWAGIGFPTKSYEVYQWGITSSPFSLEQGSEMSGSYIYSGPAAPRVCIVDGALKVERTGEGYRISGTVGCDDGKSYALNFAGAIPFEDLSSEATPFKELWSDEPGPDPGVDYIPVSYCCGYYNGSMMPLYDNDNYTFNLATEGVEDASDDEFHGYGAVVSFDLYALRGSGVIPTVGTYSAFDESKDSSLDFRYRPGSRKDGMLQGSYIWMRETATSEEVYVYIVGGTLTIAKGADGYTVTADLVGDDGEAYRYKFVGETLNIFDPFGGE